jgi:hemerythrin
MKTLYFLLILVLSFACQTPQQKSLQAFQVFEGSWQLENSHTFEIWHKHKNYLSGRVIKITNRDTLLVEKLRIFSENQELFYEATVPSQNNGQAVRFKLSKYNAGHFTFENKGHDFPQKIEYHFTNHQKLVATISGNNKKVEFNYTKTK